MGTSLMSTISFSFTHSPSLVTGQLYSMQIPDSNQMKRPAKRFGFDSTSFLNELSIKHSYSMETTRLPMTG